MAGQIADHRLMPDPAQVTCHEPGQITVPVADICRRPDGPRDRQALYGDHLTVLGRAEGWCYVQVSKDGYCGHLRDNSIGAPIAPTHRVSAPATHAYTAPDIKSPERLSLSYGSRITALAETRDFIETAQGHFPKQHLRPADHVETDPTREALNFLGTPYLWGGNSRWGIDCSGLVQAALHACGIPCPGDSDLQESQFGSALPDGSARHPGDLLFWKGHVALVQDKHTLIHANAHHMMTRVESTERALRRIAASGTPLRAHKRP